MTNHKLETIAAALLARLARITVGNGYLMTLTCERLKGETQPDHLKAVLYQDDIGEPEQTLDGEYLWTVDFGVAVFLVLAEDSSAAIDTLQNNACACIHLALTRTSAGVFDPQLAGLIDRMDIKAPQPYQLVRDGPDGVTFNFSIQYRHSASDPTT